MVRFIGVLILSVILSLAFVLGFTYSTSSEMGKGEVGARWLVMVAKDAPVAQVPKQIWGNKPPQWAQRLAVLWDQAHVPRWWWLPLLLIVGIYLFIAINGRWPS